MQSAEEIKSIKKIGFVFFILLGIIHFTASLLFTSGYIVEYTSKISRISFIPFVLGALFYLYGTIKLAMSAKEHTAWIDYAFLAFGIILLLGLLAIEFLITDSTAYL